MATLKRLFQKILDTFSWPSMGSHIDMDGNMFIRYQLGERTKGRRL